MVFLFVEITLKLFVETVVFLFVETTVFLLVAKVVVVLMGYAVFLLVVVVPAVFLDVFQKSILFQSHLISKSFKVEDNFQNYLHS